MSIDSVFDFGTKIMQVFSLIQELKFDAFMDKIQDIFGNLSLQFKIM